jgi:hypothetical protein
MEVAVMGRRIFDAIADLFGNHPIIILLGMGVLYAILELLEGRSFTKGVVSHSFYSFFKTAFFALMLLSLIGAYAYQEIFVKIDTFRKVAKTLELTYHMKDHPTADALVRLPLLRRGERRDIVSPILSGQYRDVPVILFNIRYGRTESAGESYNFYFRTVVAFSVQGQGIPEFSLLPVCSEERFSERIPGERDVTFEEDQEFSGRYRVKGAKTGALERLFGPELRGALMQDKDPWAGGVSDEHLVIFRDRQTDLKGEDEVVSYLMGAHGFYHMMVTQWQKD